MSSSVMNPVATGRSFTYTGKEFYPLDPDPALIDPIDIAHALSNLCRYNGNTSSFYSVGEHSVRMHDLAPREIKKWCLGHDFTEAYLGDVVAPLKHLPAWDHYRMAEDLLMDVIARKFGFIPLEMPSEVKVIDLRMRATEIRDITNIPDHLMGEDPYDRVIVPWTPIMAERQMLDRMRDHGIL